MKGSSSGPVSRLDASVAVPPRAPRRPERRRLHDRELLDDYGWLAERSDGATIDYLEAENRYTDAVLASIAELQERLYGEFVARIRQTDLTVPAPLDDYLYYGRTERDLQYRIYCRRRGEEGAEEILLDPNELADGESYFRIGGVEVSPDHRRLAFAVDTSGDESHQLLIRDLASGEILQCGLVGVGASFCWAADGATLFYTVLDPIRRPFEVRRHRVGSAAATDETLFREDDERFFVSVRRTRSGRYVLLRSASNTTSEVHYLPADRPDSAPRVVEPRQAGVEYHVDHRGEVFLLRTNREAKEFRLLERPVGGTPADEVELVASRPGVKLEGIEVFAEHLVLLERRRGLTEIRIRSVNTEGSVPVELRVELPEPVYTIRPEINLEYDSRVFRFGYTSLVTPATVYECDLDSGALRALKVQEVRGGYEPARFVTGRLEAPSGDPSGDPSGEVSVPVSFVHRRDLARDGSNPCLLIGYGAYGAVVEPTFSPLLVSLLERGFVFAVAHVRGGGLLGEQWHEGGRMLTKKNTFRDFEAAAEHLVAQGYTRPDRLAIRGGSAGGLLIGAVLNRRPDLFGAAVARVPFVDLLNTMLDPSIPLTVMEYEEWGNPEERTYFDYMRSYSPYDNVAAVEYPPLLVTAGLNDPRVQYWEPAKWVAKLRATKRGSQPLLLRTNMGAGHAGPSGRYRLWRERAAEYAFLIAALGADDEPG